MRTIEINSIMMKRYYPILGINSNCTLEEIKAAYRRLAKAVHPDTGGDPTRFRDIREAYETLSDPSRRKKYDNKLESLPFDGEPYKSIETTILIEPVDVYDDVVDVISRRIGIDKKTKLKTVIPVSVSEAANGVNLEIVISVKMICQRCFGFGDTLISSCSECSGKGTITVIKRGYAILQPGSLDGDTITARSGKTEIIGKLKIER
ncbi:MAG: DnaJ domain-containing protein [candidate division Zixibacteria bacterium]